MASRRWRRGFPIALLFVSVLTVGVFVVRAGDDADTAIEAEAGAAETVTIPTYRDEFHDAMYDEEGCLDVPFDADDYVGEPADDFRDGKVCPIDGGIEPLPEPPGAWVRAVGYLGPRWITDDLSGAVRVVEDASTAHVAADGTWRYVGLVRNETTATIGEVIVGVSLSGAEGVDLGELTAATLVSPVRPGEPVPFVVTSTVPATLVKDVSFSILNVGSTAQGHRDFRLDGHFDQPDPYGERARIPELDPPVPPYPYRYAGTVENRGPTALDEADVSVVVGFFDADARLVGVLKAAVVSTLYGERTPRGLPSAAADPKVVPHFFLAESTELPLARDLHLFAWGAWASTAVR